MSSRHNNYAKIGLTFFILALAVLGTPCPSSAQRYTIKNLGTMGGTSCTATGINDLGQVVGHGPPSGWQVSRAFLWDPTKGWKLDLGTLAGTGAMATAINNRGQVVGVSDTATPGEGGAFLWESGKGMRDLGTLEGFPSSGAAAINNLGQVVGYSSKLVQGVTLHRAWIWENGVMSVLPWVPLYEPCGVQQGQENSRAFDINDSGQVVGWAMCGGGALWSGGQISSLCTNPLDCSDIWPNTINNVGQVAGYGFVSEVGTIHNHNLPNFTAWGNNDLGQVVGEALDATWTTAAFIWENGALTNLNDLIPANSGWRLIHARAINNAGQIVGDGSFLGRRQAFLLTSTDSTPPTVTSTSPANGATGVAVNTPITATFSEAMNASTINTSTFTLSSGSGSVTGTVTYTGTTATFTPSTDLAGNTTYTATITTGVKDLSGNPMANVYSWSFTTGTLALNRTAGCKPCVSAAGEPVDTATGEFFIEPKVDIDLGGPLPLFFSRTYASRLHLEGEVQSSLGANWMHNFDILLKKTSLPARTAKVVYGRGNIINFEQPAQQDEWFVKSTAEDTEETVYQLREGPNREYWFMDPNRNLVYRFYDAPSNLFGKLREIQDRNGNTLSFTYDASGNLTQVSDGLGRTLTFTYDASGNLTRVSDGTRNLNYTYTNGVLTGFTDAMGNTTTYIYQAPVGSLGPLLTATQYPLGNRHHTQTYDAQGRVTSQVDAYGNALTLQYNTPSAGVTTITDALGKSRTNKHARDRVLTESTDAAGKTATITRDANDRPTAVTNRLGNTTQLSYDSETGKPASMTDARGNTGSITYTSQDQAFGPVTFRFRKPARMDFPDGTNEQFTYDAKGNMIRTIDQAGNEWTYTYDARGQLLTETNPEGGISTFTYNSDGTLASKKDSDRGGTAFEYDSLKRLTKVTNPDGSIRSMKYDANDHLIEQTDENGNKLSFTYDSNGNPVSITDALGKVNLEAYDLLDRQVESTDRRGMATETTYNVLGKVESLIDPEGNTIQYEYNENGWLVQGIDGAGKIWRTGYDEDGTKILEISPLGNTLRYEYDQVGNLTKVTDPLGNSAILSWDSMSRQTSSTDPLGRKIEYSYDNLGHVIGVKQSGLGSAIFTRNSLGNLGSITDPRGKTWSLAYTPMGLLSSKNDPLGNETRFTYNKRGRLTQIAYPDAQTETFTYDGAGNLLETSHSIGEKFQQTYDALNRLISAKGISLSYDEESNITNTPDGDVDFGASYDNADRVKSVSYNNNAFIVNYTYDKRNYLTQVTDSLTGATVRFIYDDDGRLTTINRSNGVATTYTWDAASRITRIQDGTIADQQYSYNAAGEITQVTQTLPLDPESLLIPSTEPFTYDDASQINSTGYIYDSRGQQSTSPSHIFTWDGAGRLTGTGSATLEYNGFGDLIRRNVGGTTIRYYYNHAVDFSPIMAEKDDSTGLFLRYYVWTPFGDLLYMIDATVKRPISITLTR